jgi:hypothetical protein
MSFLSFALERGGARKGVPTACSELPKRPRPPHWDRRNGLSIRSTLLPHNLEKRYGSWNSFQSGIDPRSPMHLVQRTHEKKARRWRAVRPLHLPEVHLSAHATRDPAVAITARLTTPKRTHTNFVRLTARIDFFTQSTCQEPFSSFSPEPRIWSQSMTSTDVQCPHHLPVIDTSGFILTQGLL